MIRVVVVDDHAVVRTGICRIFDAEPDLEVIGQAGRGHDGVRLCRALEPDVVVLDYGLPDLDGLETARQIIALGNRTRILVLTMHASEEYATRMIQVGAAGFIVKAAPTEKLLMAVRKVAAGGIYVSPSVMEKMSAM